VEEETVEDREGEGKDGLFVRDTVFEQPVTDRIFDDRNEIFTIQEGSPWPLYYCQDEFKSKDLGSHSEGIHHTALGTASNYTCIDSSWDILKTEFADALENYQSISVVPFRLFSVVEIRHMTIPISVILWSLNRIKQIYVFLFAFKRADRVSSVLAVEISLPSADDAPTKFSSLHAMLILEVNLRHLSGPGSLIITGFGMG